MTSQPPRQPTARSAVPSGWHPAVTAAPAPSRGCQRPPAFGDTRTRPWALQPGAFAILLLLAGVPNPAAALSGGAQSPVTQTVPEVVPPTATPPAAAPAGEAGLSVRQTVTELPGSEVSEAQTLTLDFAEVSDYTAEMKARGPIGQALDTIAYWFDYLVNVITNGLTPPTPESFANSVKSKDPNNMWRLVGDAGYKLKEITTDVGVVPDLGFRFKYVRELSDGDINWLERKLARHAQKYKDPLSVVQRMIIYTLLSINSSDVYFVSELRIKLLPLPQAQFSLQPWDSGLSDEHDTLLRAIQGKKIARRKPAEEDSHY